MLCYTRSFIKFINFNQKLGGSASKFVLFNISSSEIFTKIFWMHQIWQGRWVFCGISRRHECLGGGGRDPSGVAMVTNSEIFIWAVAKFIESPSIFTNFLLVVLSPLQAQAHHNKMMIWSHMFAFHKWQTYVHYLSLSIIVRMCICWRGEVSGYCISFDNWIIPLVYIYLIIWYWIPSL